MLFRHFLEYWGTFLLVMHSFRFQRFSAAVAALCLLVSNTAHAVNIMYVTNYGSSTVSVVNLVSRQVTQTIVAGTNPWGIARSGTGVYVVHETSNSVSVIDTSNYTVESTIGVGADPQEIVINGTGAYVSNYTDGTVTIIDITDNTVEATLSLGANANGLATSGTGVYVTVESNDTVKIIDTTNNRVENITISVGATPARIGISGTGAYVVNYFGDSISVIDITNNQVERTINVGTNPWGIAFAGTGAYISNYTNDTVSMIDMEDNQVEATISVGDGPNAVAVTGTGVYVVSSNTNTVVVIDSANNQVEGSITVGNGPSGIAFATDSTTLAPILTTPAPGSTVALCDDLAASYTLPEAPSSGSVELSFFNIGTSATVDLTLNNSTGATFNLDLENFSASANVVSTTGGNRIVAGSYVVSLQYQDQFSNTVEDDTANLLVNACASSSSPSGPNQSGRGGGVREVTQEMKQEAAIQRFGNVYGSSSSAVSSIRSSAAAGFFTDVPRTSWFYEFIERLRVRDIVSGYKNTAGEETKIFGPGDKVTYGQLAKMVLNLIDRAPSSMKADLHWAEPYVREARKNGLTVFADTSLNLDTTASRGAVVRTILEAYGISLEALPQNTFSDLPDDHPYLQDILTALTLSILTGDDGADTVRPDDSINRAEVSKILVRVSGKFSPKIVQTSSSSTSSMGSSSAEKVVTETQQSDKDIRHVATAILNVRSDARINATLLWVARQGQEFEVLRIVGEDWAHVRVSDGNEGYVWVHHLSK